MRNLTNISLPLSAPLNYFGGGGILLIVSELHANQTKLNNILQFRLVSSDTGSACIV